jgi:hypothetical protein
MFLTSGCPLFRRKSLAVKTRLLVNGTLGVKMKAISLTFIALNASVTTCQSQEVVCPKELRLVEGSMPDYPSPEQAKAYLQGTSYLHVFIEGSVVVAFTVTSSGVVTDARIAKSSYKPVGRNASRYAPGYFDGFLEMNVLPAVSTWRYSPRVQSCNGEFTFTYRVSAQQAVQPDRREDAAPG